MGRRTDRATLKGSMQTHAAARRRQSTRRWGGLPSHFPPSATRPRSFAFTRGTDTRDVGVLCGCL
eukprot:6319401-Prorocentrum_lima.AAC.1